MQIQPFLPALALLAPLVSAQSNTGDAQMPVVSAFLEWADNEGLSSLSAEGLTVQASLYSSLVDSIEGVLSTAAPSEKSFVESYVSQAVFADPSLSSVMASITSEYAATGSTPATTASDGSAASTGSASSSTSDNASAVVDARHVGVASAAAGALVLGLAVFM